MKLSEYINQLQEFKKIHGGDIPVLVYVDDYDGCGDFYTSADAPEIIDDNWLIDDLSDVPTNGWLGKNSSDIRKSKNKISFKKAIVIG